MSKTTDQMSDFELRQAIKRCERRRNAAKTDANRRMFQADVNQYRAALRERQDG